MAAHLGLKPGQTVHVYCGGGGAAAVPFFALRFVLGREQVKLYNESQREWLRDERGLPLWTHAAPSMLRRMAWLDGWASPMLRLFGFAQIRVVDLRTPEAYRQGHVPFVVNIPADVFRAHLHQSDDKLAALLGAAGVDAAHEAVIVADGGLDANGAPKAAKNLWSLLAKAGVPRYAQIVAFADDPGEAAVSYFVLKLMGCADVKLGGITTSARRAQRTP